MIKVEDGGKKEGEEGAEVDAEKEAENLTLSINQFEMVLSDLKTRHLAEKRMLQCDLALCKKTIKLMAHSLRNNAKEKQRNEIRMLQIKKLQEVNKFLKSDNGRLVNESRVLTE